MSTAIGHGLVGPETWGKPVRAIHGLDDFLGGGNLFQKLRRINPPRLERESGYYSRTRQQNRWCVKAWLKCGVWGRGVYAPFLCVLC